MKTSATKKSQLKQEWHLVDLKGQVLGRVATDIAQKLIGKNKVNWAPYLDCGDYVVAVNAKQVKVTGQKESQKKYYHHTFYPGGLREYTYEQLFAKDSRQLITRAVKNMLPKNKLRQDRLARLKVYVDDKHPYQSKFAKDSK